jgi:hypothetical protein
MILGSSSAGVPITNKNNISVAFGGGGGATTRIIINSDNFSQTGSASGWSIDDTNEKALMTWDRNTTVQSIWCDLVDILGEAIDTEWNLRYHQKLTGDYSQTTGVGCYLVTGIYNQDGSFPSHGATSLSGHTFNAEAYPAGNDREVLYPFIDDTTAYEAGSYVRVPTVSAATWSSNGAEFYIEVIRDGSTMTMNFYSDSDYSTLISNGTAELTGTMTTDTLTHLILCHNYNYSASSWNGSGSFEIDSLYFNNGSTDAGAPF